MEPVGYLNREAQLVVDCPECALMLNPHRDSADSSYVPIYQENLGQYQQHCWTCKRVINTRANVLWPELFDGAI